LNVTPFEQGEVHVFYQDSFLCRAVCAELSDSIATMPSRWQASVLLETTLEQVRWAVPSTFATLEERADGILLRAFVDDLDHLTRF
jgi:hypothetical protein